MIDLEELTQMVKKFNENNPGYNGYAYFKLYDDGSGGIKWLNYESNTEYSILNAEEFFQKYEL